MNLKLKKVHLKNFLSFEDETVELCNNGYTLVSGVNENPDDLARSNGSGKSSIWEAISWCLTGETIRGTKEVKRLGSESECLVELLFDVDRFEYKVVRTKDPSNLKIYLDGEDKSGKGIRDTERLLEDYLPDLTSSLIGSVIILGQGLPQRFTNNSPSGRKEVLEKLSKSDFMITDLKNRIAHRKAEIEKDIRGYEDSVLSDTTRINVLQKQLEDTQEKLNNLPDKQFYENSILGLERQLKELEDELSKIDTTSLEEGLTNSKDKLNAIKVDVAEKTSSIEREYNEKSANFLQDKSSLETKISLLKKEIEKLKNIKDVCPTCGQKLPNVHKQDTSVQEKELEDYNNQLATVKTEIYNLSSEKDIKINEVKDNSKKDVDSLNSEIATNIQMLESFKRNISLINNNIKSLSDKKIEEESNLSNLERNKKDYIDTIENLKNDLVEINNRICYNNKSKENLDSHLNVINKMSTIITRDFRGYLLTNIIDFINKKSKEYSKDVFDTDKINFVIDGNNISISYDGKEYENLSGGEKQKVDLIVQLAIRDMLCTYLDFSCNILVVDELFDNLDDIGCQRIINLISNKISDVDSIYIVTHHSDIQIPTDSEIVVVKGCDKISRIRR